MIEEFNKTNGKRKARWPAVLPVPPFVGAGHRLVRTRRLRIQTAIHATRENKAGRTEPITAAPYLPALLAGRHARDSL